MNHTTKKLIFILLLIYLFGFSCRITQMNLIEVKRNSINDNSLPLLIENHPSISFNNSTDIDNFFSGNMDGLSWETPYLLQNLIISENSQGFGIEIKNSNKYLLIKNCSILNKNIGISLKNSSHIKIANCNIYYNYQGIEISDSGNLSILDNSISNCNGSGIEIKQSNNITITQNNIFRNKINGIHMRLGSNNNTISYNNISFNYLFGIYIVESSFNQINNNLLNKNISMNMKISENQNSVNNNENNYSLYYLFDILNLIMYFLMYISWIAIPYSILKKKLTNKENRKPYSEKLDNDIKLVENIHSIIPHKVLIKLKKAIKIKTIDFNQTYTFYELAKITFEQLGESQSEEDIVKLADDYLQFIKQ